MEEEGHVRFEMTTSHAGLTDEGAERSAVFPALRQSKDERLLKSGRR